MLTVKEIAIRLKVSPGCVYALCACGRIPHLRLGIGRGAIRVVEADLQEFVELSRQRRPAIVPTFRHIKLSR